MLWSYEIIVKIFQKTGVPEEDMSVLVKACEGQSESELLLQNGTVLTIDSNIKKTAIEGLHELCDQGLLCLSIEMCQLQTYDTTTFNI